MIRWERILRFFYHIHPRNPFFFVFVINKIANSSGSERHTLDSNLFLDGVRNSSINILYLNSILLFSRLRLRNFSRETYANNFELVGLEFLPFLDDLWLWKRNGVLRSIYLYLISKDPSRVHISVFILELKRLNSFKWRVRFLLLLRFRFIHEIYY